MQTSAALPDLEPLPDGLGEGLEVVTAVQRRQVGVALERGERHAFGHRCLELLNGGVEAAGADLQAGQVVTGSVQMEAPGARAPELGVEHREVQLPRLLEAVAELEAVGLVRLVGTRRRRNCTERIVRATAPRYVISPEALAELGATGAETGDRMSSSALVAVAARIVREVGVLRERARAARRRLATFSLSTDLRFRSAADRNRFAEELATAVAGLVARYHDDDAPGGRSFRLAVGIHPAVEEAREGVADGSGTGGPDEP